MTTLASLRILLGLDPSGVRTGASKVNDDLKGVQRQANATNDTLRQIGKGIGAGFGIGAGIGAFNLATQATRAFVGGVSDSVDAARDLTETINKSRVVFGPAAAEIQKFGETAATSLGLSKNAAIGAAATFGNLFVSLGTAPDDVAPMSRALVTLAGDLASFNNISVDEALTSLRSGIVGEVEPMRRLGVAINAIAVEAKAAELGFKRLNGGFTEGEKVQARYALILEQTGTAQGDFSRTSQDLANQQRILDAQLENVSAQLGAAMIPLLTELARVINNDVIPALSGVVTEDLPDFAENSEREIKQLTEALQFIASPLGNVADLWRSNAALAGASGQAFGEVTVASTDLSASLVAQERATLQAAKANAILTGDTAQAKAAQYALDAAAADVTNELNKQAVANLALEKTAAQNIATAKAWSVRVQDNAGLMEFFTAKVNEATGALSFFDQTQAGTFSTMQIPGLESNGVTGVKKGEGMTLAESYIERLLLANQNAAAAAARAAAAKATADARAAQASADAKRDAAALAATYREKLMRAYDDTARAAHDMYAKIHQDNLKAIDDVRDLANAALSEQQRAIRGAVDAERDRVAAIRTHRQEQSLRTAVSVATDPEELARAQQQLNDFLDDQRIAFLSSQADTQIAALDAEKAKNDAVAALATAAENQRNKDQVAALDKDLRNLKDHLAKYTKEWGKAFAEIAALAKKHRVSDLVGAAAASTVAASKATSAIAVPPDVPAIKPPPPIALTFAPLPDLPVMPPPPPITFTFAPFPPIPDVVPPPPIELSFAPLPAIPDITPPAPIEFVFAPLPPIPVFAPPPPISFTFAPLPDLPVLATPPPVTRPVTGPAATPSAAAGLAPREFVVHTHLHLGPDEIAEAIERYQFNLEGIYNPTPVSTGSQR